MRGYHTYLYEHVCDITYYCTWVQNLVIITFTVNCTLNCEILVLSTYTLEVMKGV